MTEVRFPSSFPTRRMVANTQELRRVAQLPRRKIDGQGFVQMLTNALRTSTGEETLRPIQAQALYDMGDREQGLFGPLRVGSGKTLITLLAPLLLKAKRPVLLIPANLMGKTEDDRQRLMKHWKIPTSTRIISYEMLGRVQGATLLDFYQPDLIVMDECHKLKNKKAGVTRRVVRYFREHPDTKCVAVSGTVMKSSIKDFAHIVKWCLKEDAPVPASEEELESWADALDEKVNMFQRLDPGALVAFSGGDSELGAIRRGFQARLLETPGVVGTTGDQVACSLYVEGHIYGVRPETEANFNLLREKWETPTGWTFSEPVEAWRHARELALGFHYEWDPPGPTKWLEARKQWAKFVRDTLSHSRTLDTELQVANAFPDCEELMAWRDIRGTFKPNTVARWHDPSALEWCVKWMQKGPGIVWVEHVLFAKALAKATGRPYFGAGGVDALGNPIEKATGAIIASIAANGTGRNLQKWSRNLITSCPTTAPIWEQLIGRTHRDGQLADAVTVDLMLGCSEHFSGFNRAKASAVAQQDMLGHQQKLLIADIILPEKPEGVPKVSDRWVDTKMQKPQSLDYEELFSS